MATVVALGALGVVTGFAMVFGVVPGPSAVRNIDLSGRRELWTAAYEAVADRPAIGWGPGNDIRVLAEYAEGHLNATHNSYLRMFLISGVLGGVTYLVLVINVVITGLRYTRSEAIFTFLLLVAFLVLQLFAGMTIFGLSLLSVLGALFVGYTQSSGTVRRKRLDIRAWATEFITDSVI